MPKVILEFKYEYEFLSNFYVQENPFSYQDEFYINKNVNHLFFIFQIGHKIFSVINNLDKTFNDDRAS